MFEEIRACLTILQNLTGSENNGEVKGQLIQRLKQIDYFNLQVDMYGCDILISYIPIMEPYILRQGCQIIDQNAQYVIIEGLVKGHDKKEIRSVGTFTDGIIIDASNYSSLMSETDTTMLKIYKACEDKINPQVRMGLIQLQRIQKQRSAKLAQFQKQLSLNPQHVKCKEKLASCQFFSALGTYDLCTLAVESKFYTLNRGQTTHRSGEYVLKLLCILSGQIKVVHHQQKSENCPIGSNNKIIRTYKESKKYRQQNNSVITYMGKGQWIGLEQYFHSGKFNSEGEVSSHEAQILEIPCEAFRAKFNEITNYSVLGKVNSLMKSKKEMIMKMLMIKKRRSAFEHESDVEKKNEEKMRAIEKMQCRLLQQQNDETKWEIKKRKAHLDRTLCPRQCYMPERLTHKVRLYEKKYASLPKIQERVTLFPEQYEKAYIPLSLRDELHAMQLKRQEGPLKSNRSFQVVNSQKIHEKVLFETLSPKKPHNPQNPQAIIGRDPNTNANPLEWRDLAKATKYKQNKSIFNNFRIPFYKGEKFEENWKHLIDRP